MKCWIVFSLAALLDLALPPSLQGKKADLVKITFLLWCLAPLNINGSDVLFDLVLAPLHWLLTTALQMFRPVWDYLVVRLSQHVVRPTLETLHQILALLINNIQLVVSATPGTMQNRMHQHLVSII